MTKVWLLAISALLAMPCCWIALNPLDRTSAIVLVALVAALGLVAVFSGARLLSAPRGPRRVVLGWAAVSVGLGAIVAAGWALPITFASTWSV